jgi:hypothetical protein
VSLIITLHIIVFLYLLSTNHKCTQPCYFSLLYKPAAQKMDMKNSLTRSSRLALPRLLSCGLWSLSLFCFARVILVSKDIIYIIIILIRDIWLYVNTLCPCVWNKWSWAHMRWVFGFFIKSGITPLILAKGHEQKVQSYLPWWRSSNSNLGPSFIIFWVMDNFLWI